MLDDWLAGWLASSIQHMIDICDRWVTPRYSLRVGAIPVLGVVFFNRFSCDDTGLDERIVVDCRVDVAPSRHSSNQMIQNKKESP